MVRLAALATCVHLAWSSDGDRAADISQQNDPDVITDVAQRLNGEIKGSGGAYTAGKGVLVRTPDFFTGDTKVVPATLWSNDIFAPSQLYPATVDPMCPTNGDGWSQLTKDCGGKSPWDRATVAVVISSDISSFLPEWDHVQDADWGWGVFYPFDSNSGDHRCHWRDDWNGWDCPGGFLEADGVTFDQDSSKGGAGQYAPGNPYVDDQTGGGTGCHIDYQSIDQMDAEDTNLVQDPNCQCNYAFNNDWYQWVQQWMGKGYQKGGFEWRGWFANGKAPNWGVDSSVCWVNNVRDMISLQNQLYWHSEEWNNQLMPQSNWGSGSKEDRIYWGWNEVPVDTSKAADPGNWDSIIIKLPADICNKDDGRKDNHNCLGKDQMRDLHDQLKSFEDAGHLLTGSEHITQRPGSYVLFVREYRVNSGWERQFFCQHAYIEDREIHTKYNACYYDKKGSDIIA